MTTAKRPSYKPAENRLVLTEELKRLQYTLFKGVTSKTVRISGELLKSVEAFFDSQMTPDGEVSLQAAAGTLMKAFHTTNDKYVNARKKRVFKTGVNHKGSQLLLTQYVYPVEHVKGVTISMVGLDFRNLVTNEARIRASYWTLSFDPGYGHLEDYYTETVRVDDATEDTPMDELFIDMIFAVVPPKEAA